MIRFFLFLTLFVSSFSSACEKIVRVIEFAPYSMKVDEQWQGLHVDLSHELLKAINCSPLFIEFPFARAMTLLKSGQIDMVFQLTKTQDREPFIFFVGPIHIEKLILVAHHTVNTPISTLEQITSLDKQFGVQRGVYMGPDFNELFSKNKFFRNRFRFLSEVDPLISMVNKHRLDGFFIEQVHFQYMQKNSVDYQKVSAQPVPVYETPVYVGLSKKNFSPADVKKVENAFNHMKNTSSLKNLQNYYLSDSLKP